MLGFFPTVLRPPAAGIRPVAILWSCLVKSTAQQRVGVSSKSLAFVR